MPRSECKLFQVLLRDPSALRFVGMTETAVFVIVIVNVFFIVIVIVFVHRYRFHSIKLQKIREIPNG